MTAARACLFDGPQQPLRIERFAPPVPSAGEIVVRIRCCTLCGSDLHTYVGRRSEPTPTVLGHEILGEIVELAPNAPRVDALQQPLESGDRVTWSVAAACGTCFYCRHDLPQKCESLYKYGHRVATSDRPWVGGLADYCTLVPGTAIVKLPTELPDLVACPANCATATVAAALRVAGGCRGEVVLVQGAGMLGLTACAMAHSQGAASIIVSDRDSARLELARAFGATDVVHADDQQLVEQAVRQRSDDRGVDLALELTGATAAIRHGLELLRTGGRYVLVGSVMPSEPIPLDPQQVVRRMLTICGLHNYAPADLLAAVDFLRDNHTRFPFSELISAQFPLEQADAAFGFAAEHRPLRVAVAP